MSDDLTYGLWRTESFVVLSTEWAHRAEDELTRLRAVTTWGEAMRVAKSLETVFPPFDPDTFLDEAEIDPAEPVTADELPGVADGDFPRMPASYTEDFLPDDLLWNDDELPQEWVETTFNGGYLRIPPDAEESLVRALHARGYRTTRDDALIDRLAWFD